MKDFEAKLRVYLEERGWDKVRPGDIAKSIMIEGGELLENFQWENPTSEQVKANPEKMANIQKELADVMTYCFDMAIILDLDVEKLLNEKLQKTIEKYPAHLFQDRTKEPGQEDAYWEIKEEYRKDGKN